MGEQMSLALQDVVLTNAEDPTHEVVYSNMKVGSAVGNMGRAPRDAFDAMKNLSSGMRVVKCGKCRKPAITKHNNANEVFVHAERISTSVSGRTRRTVTKVCRVKRAKP